MTEQTLASAAVEELRRAFRAGGAKIEHCLAQLDDEQIWWRPRDEMNSIANLMLHLSGNLGQWVISAVGGRPDVRNRPAEFADRSRRCKDEITSVLKATLAQVDEVLSRMRPDELLQPRKVQGFDETAFSAALHAAVHFQGHVQEIIHMTRAQLGDSYRFEFVPKTEAQLSAKGPVL
jgi:hypothetical protein